MRVRQLIHEVRDELRVSRISCEFSDADLEAMLREAEEVCGRQATIPFILNLRDAQSSHAGSSFAETTEDRRGRHGYPRGRSPIPLFCSPPRGRVRQGRSGELRCARLTPQEIATSYDRIAERWFDDAFNRKNGRAQHQRALAFLKGTGGAALDVGCGCNGRIIEWLKESQLVPEGLDLSAKMLRLARLRHPEVTFHHADICEWEPPLTFDFISAWDSLWHVPLVKQPAVLAKLCSALAPNGVLIFSAGGVDAPEERVDQAMGVPMYHASLGVPRICSVVHESGCALRHLEHDQPPSAHLFVIAQRR